MAVSIWWNYIFVLIPWSFVFSCFLMTPSKAKLLESMEKDY